MNLILNILILVILINPFLTNDHKIHSQLSLAAELCFGGSRGYYRRRKHENGRRYQGRKYHHRSHSHDLYEYYEPTYERVYERDYDPQHNEVTTPRNHHQLTSDLTFYNF